MKSSTSSAKRKPGTPLHKRYKSGRAFEYRIAKMLREEGWFVIRAAGSHGIADLVAAKGGQWRIIQCKNNGKLPPDERTALIRLAVGLNAIPIFAYKDGRKAVLRRLY